MKVITHFSRQVLSTSSGRSQFCKVYKILLSLHQVLLLLLFCLLSEKISEREIFSLKVYTNARTYTGIFPVPLSDSSVCASLILLRSSWNMSKSHEDFFQCKIVSLQNKKKKKKNNQRLCLMARNSGVLQELSWVLNQGWPFLWLGCLSWSSWCRFSVI